MSKKEKEQFTNADALKEPYFIWQLERSLLPKAKFEKQEIVLDDENDCDADAYERLNEIKRDIYNFVRDGKNLYICSDTVGNGKTTWSIKMLQYYLYQTQAKGYCSSQVTGLFISVPKLLANLKDFTTTSAQKYVEYVKKNIEKVDLVVWDDFALEESTSYDRLQLYVFLNDRIFAEQANIFTSNVDTRETLQKYVGDRLVSRSFEVSEVIKLEGMGGR